jgi:arsenate reductase (glutaredoxin)
MQTVIVYGIPNCDTIKKTILWLKENKISFQFHDYKKEGIAKSKLDDWCTKAGWENIFNKKSTSWRELPKAEQDKVISKQAAIKVMLANNSIIKRPIVELNNNKILVGFNSEQYEKEII